LVLALLLTTPALALDLNTFRAQHGRPGAVGELRRAGIA
jgi:hypothetical protein